MTKQKRVMAIHDISCIGRCSLTVALPIISAAGFDCGVLPTAVLSTHTGGFTGYTYRDLTSDMQPTMDHWQSLGIKFDAMYSGFLGSIDQIDIVIGLFDNFKEQDCFVLVDPVMADNGKLYAVYTTEMVKGMARLCASADIIVPNLTEAAFLIGEQYVGDKYDESYIHDLLIRLTKLGPGQIVLTGVSYEPGQLGAACYDNLTGKFGYYALEQIDGYFHGTGDVFGSALLCALLRGANLEEATRLAVCYTHKCIILTLDADTERRYGVRFEKALPDLINMLDEIEQ
ncbi:MAG: pyridoxamine kinase [Clostridiales bacterium]|nr:pyridoxamine kinase [Clostridiales bacterium]